MALPREEFFTIINFIDLCLEEQSNGFPKNFSCNFVLRTYAIALIGLNTENVNGQYLPSSRRMRSF